MSRPNRHVIAVSGVLVAALAASTVVVADTAQRLELLERRVARITELTMQVDQLQRENRELRGTVEQLGFELQQLERKQRDLYLDLDQRIGGDSGGALAPATGAAAPAGSTAAPTGSAAAPTGSAAPAAVVRPRTAAPPSPPATASTVAPKAPTTADRRRIEAEYQAAYALLSPQQRRYREAAEAFDNFIAKYPDDQLTPNAHYWLGEAHYVSENNAGALKEFKQVIERFPNSSKAPGALFKIGRLQQAAGDGKAATASYRRVIADYPDSPAAGLAKQRLKQLGR